MTTTIKAAVAAMLRALAAWAVRRADGIDPPAVEPDGAGGAGPVVPPPRPK